MTPEHIIQLLEEKKISIGLVDGELKVVLEDDADLDDDTLALLKENKPALIAYLAEQEKQAATADICHLDDAQLAELKRTYPLVDKVYATTPMQKGMFVDSIIEERGVNYTMQFCLDITGAINIPLFFDAWQHLVNRHESLRTAFWRAGSDESHQVVLSDVALDSKLLDWRNDMAGKSQEEIEQAVTDFVLADQVEPFDLATAPMIRITMLQLTDDSYSFVWAYHHTIIDGWSISVLIGEILAVYQQLLKGQSPELPPVTHYSDYIQWLAQRDEDEAREFWQQHLANIDNKAELVIDKLAKNDLPFGSQTYRAILPERLSSKLDALSKQYHFTTNAAVQLAWAHVLYSYNKATDSSTEQYDVVFGTTVSGRPSDLEGFDTIVGLFINSIPLRLQLSPDTNITQLLSSLQLTNIERQEHGYLPVLDIQQQAGLSGDESLYESLLVFENFPEIDEHGETEDHHETPLQLKVRESASSQLALPLCFDIIYSNQIKIKLHYRTELFEPVTIERLVSHLEHTLEQIANCDATTTIANLTNIPEEEQQLLLTDWNGQSVRYDTDSCIHELVEQYADETPNAVAAIEDGEEYTYEELNSQANQLANYLIMQGVKPGKKVILCIERSIDQLVGMLGILKAGGCYVPLSPDMPEERLAHVFAQTEADVILADSESLADLPTDDQTVFVLDEEVRETLLSALPDEDIDTERSGITPEDPAYIIFTSGSTGQPKGVVISHAAAQNYLDFGRRNYFSVVDAEGEQTAVNRAVASLPLVFDASVTTLLLPLCSGKTVEIIPEGTKQLDVLAKTIANAKQPALFKLTPAHLIALSHLIDVNKLTDEQKSLKHVFVLGGEQLTGAILAPWKTSLFPAANYINEYGPTEAVVGCTNFVVGEHDPLPTGNVPIGKPLDNVGLYVLDNQKRPLPVGVPGELYIGGVSLADGYLNQSAQTAAAFTQNPFATTHSHDRLYQTGDRVRWLADGNLEFMERADQLIKIRGYRIEPGDIEQKLVAEAHIEEAFVQAWQDEDGQSRLVAYLLGDEAHRYNDETEDAVVENRRGSLVSEVRQSLRRQLPRYMVPEFFVFLNKLPITSNGKLDKAAFPAPTDKDRRKDEYVAPVHQLEKTLCEIWQQALKLERVGVKDNFFDLGGNSLILLNARQQIIERTGIDISVTDLFTYPTIAELTRHLEASGSAAGADVDLGESRQVNRDDNEAVAVISMAGHFPGADNVDEYWNNIVEGVESIQFFSKEELEDVYDAETLNSPDFVNTGALVNGIEYFDADFFGLTPREAEITEPQQRQLLECAHDVLDTAGYGDWNSDRDVGVFVGVGENKYLFNNLLSQPEKLANLPTKALTIANAKDFVATRIAYKLNLRGPALSLNTACSTSLVSIHYACQSLLNGECNMAIAGGAGISSLGPVGFQYEPGGILSPDGHCRVFDKNSNGTRIGNGVGVILLKRLSDALADGDDIEAVILGSATNNDGANKAGFTAPSVLGQAKVIRHAMQAGGVEPETVQYIETHGTGTNLGDPIEIDGLKKAFHSSVFDEQSKQSPVYLGSVKPNVGHCDTAAGVAGAIKTVQALKHQTVPPMINFEAPNPAAGIEGSGFEVNTSALPWPETGHKHRAGISSFGIGGTNAHVIMEQAPTQTFAEDHAPDYQLLMLSARSDIALQSSADRLATDLASNTQPLNQISYTLQAGRTAHNKRWFTVVDSKADAQEVLKAFAAQPGVAMKPVSDREKSLIFMFPGQGSQYQHMATDLYQTYPVFTAAFDEVANYAQQFAALDLNALIFADQDSAEELAKTATTQPALFAVEYALAKLLMSLGLKPDAMIGHSIGEYVAATLAGVFTLENAVQTVCLRGQLMQSAAPGSMLSVSADAEHVKELLADTSLSMAAVNSPSDCVVSGETVAIEAFEQTLQHHDISCRRLVTSHAYHSVMMEPVLAAFAAHLDTLTLQQPESAVLSNVSGQFAGEEITTTEYWVNHLRGTVNFATGITTALQDNDTLRDEKVLLEVGPGIGLSQLSRKTTKHLEQQTPVITTLSHPKDKQSDVMTVLAAVGQLWQNGVAIDWQALHIADLEEGETRQLRRVKLPAYPFDKKRYWIDAVPVNYTPTLNEHCREKRTDINDWFYTADWQLTSVKAMENADSHPVKNKHVMVMFADEGCDLMIETLSQAQPALITCVQHGEQYQENGHYFTINPTREDDFKRMMTTLSGRNQLPDRVIHLGNIVAAVDCNDDDIALNDYWRLFSDHQLTGFDSLIYLARQITMQDDEHHVAIDVVTPPISRITGAETICPISSTVSALARVIPQEYENIICHLMESDAGLTPQLMAQICQESGLEHRPFESAWRYGARWAKGWQHQHLEKSILPTNQFDSDGAYIITGGLGNIALLLVEHLAARQPVKIALSSRRGLPDKSSWESLTNAEDGDPRIVSIVKRLMAVEAQGSEVHVYAADVADYEEMATLFDAVERDMGTIKGVIHAAGTVNGTIEALMAASPEQVDDLYRSKVLGTQVLDKLLESRQPDFCLLMSSLSAVLGGLGYSLYASANAWLDAFAQHKHNMGDTRWTAVNWDGWTFSANEASAKSGSSQYHMNGKEGVLAMEHSLALGNYPVLINSTGSLTERLKSWVELDKEHAEEHTAAAGNLYARPNLSTPWVAAETETAQRLVGLWQDIIGIEGIGIKDNFFELGGDSLMMIRMKTRLDKAFSVDVPIDVLFSTVNIDGLSTYLDDVLVKQKVFSATESFEEDSLEEI